MPIYEYRCEACGHLHDALQKISDDPLSECPECAKPALKRLISAPSFRLKGSGWYETDFKSDKERKRNLVDGSGKESGGNESGKESGKEGGKDSSSESAKSSSDGAKSESKPKDSGSDTKSSKSKESGSKASGTGSEAA